MLDLVTTFYGFSLGLVEADGIYIPFVAVLVMAVPFIVGRFFYGRGRYRLASGVVCGYSVVFALSPILNNMLLIGGIIA